LMRRLHWGRVHCGRGAAEGERDRVPRQVSGQRYLGHLGGWQAALLLLPLLQLPLLLPGRVYRSLV
jgi:hypothetical protein